MQLKWKIFLVSLFLITAAVSVTAFVVLRLDFSAEIENLRSAAVREHTYLSVSLQNRIAYERLSDDVPVLGDDDIARLASLTVGARISNRDKNRLCGGHVRRKDEAEPAISSFGELPELSLLPKTDDMEIGKSYCRIYSSEKGAKRLAVCSVAAPKEGTLYIYTLYDIDSAYESYGASQLKVGIASVSFGIVISLVLFAVTSAMLRPLSDMNDTLRLIAGGDYSQRAAVRGGAEEKEIAENINAVAESVEETVDRLESIANGRKRYIDSLAHEMKTPLTSILCFGDLLRIKRSVSDEERIEYSGIIVDEARRMKNLSSKLLELACADSMELDMEPTSVRELLEESRATIAPALKARGIHMDYSGDDGTVMCDRELFKSLIYNLCDNAAKASEAGQTVRLRSKAADNGMIISVSDSGIGMTKDVLKKVTEPFYMADKSRSRKAGGAGLGLSLCVEIAKRHGARLTAKSKPGVGTSIFITVPWAKSGEAKK